MVRDSAHAVGGGPPAGAGARDVLPPRRPAQPAAPPPVPLVPQREHDARHRALRAGHRARQPRRRHARHVPFAFGSVHVSDTCCSFVFTVRLMSSSNAHVPASPLCTHRGRGAAAAVLDVPLGGPRAHGELAHPLLPAHLPLLRAL